MTHQRIGHVRGSRGFTLVELLLVMSLIVSMMSTLSEAFSEGVDSFRDLKAIGDMQEKMRSAAILLREDLLETHFHAREFLADSMERGRVDADEAVGLREAYDSIYEQADELEAWMVEVLRKTVSPAEKRVLMAMLEQLEGLRDGADKMVMLLAAAEAFGTPTFTKTGG